MATKPLTLSGIVEPASKAASEGAAQEWRREKQRLEEEILGLRRELDDARIQNEKLERSLRTLRKQLGPLHHALRAVFGEIELAIGEEDVSPVATSGQPVAVTNNSDPRWESYKATFPGVRASIIDALMSHPQMTITQLSTMVRRDYSTVKDALPALVKAGAVTRSGTKNALFSLNR